MNDLAAVAATELNNNNKPVNMGAGGSVRSSTPGSVHGDSNSGFQTPNSVTVNSGRNSVSPNPQAIATSRPQLKVVIPPGGRNAGHMVRSSVCLSVCLSICLSVLQLQLSVA